MKNRITLLLVCVFIQFALWPTSTADSLSSPDKSHLTLERIFATDEFKVKSFGPAHWLSSKSGYTQLEKTSIPGLDGMDIVLHMPGQKKSSLLVSAKQLIEKKTNKSLPIDEYSWSDNGQWLMIFTNSQPVWRQNTRGDYWVLNLKSGLLWQIGADAEASCLMFAKFSPDSARVAYVYKNDIYTQTLSDTQAERRISRLTQDGCKTIINGTSDWVYEEEFHLRDGFCWAPDSRHIAYWQFNSTEVNTFYLINNTDTLYPALIPIPYPKAGTANSSCRIGVVNTAGGQTTWVDLPGDAHDFYIPRMDWAASSEELIFQRMNRLQNTNQLLQFNIHSKVCKTVLTEKDEAWLEVVDDLQWLSKGQQFTWISERDGWRHIYVVSRDGQSLRCITPGAYDVISVCHIDEKSGWVYFLASPNNPTQKYLFRVRLSGSEKPQRITPANMPGTHSYRISQDGRWAFHSYSAFASPPQTQLISLPDHRQIKTLVDNLALQKAVKQIALPPVEFFDVDIGDGITLNAWCLKPTDFDASKRYPVLFYVYGEPAGQTVTDSYGRSYPWYAMLAQQGYVVMSVDNRGTPQPRGRNWRKSVYRQIGILASADQAAATRAIITSRSYVDPERIGIWGWSGGGTMTLNMMFRHPGLYKTGMAVAAVPDMRLYDSIYQERYMGLPAENEEGYKNGSPITFAQQLEGKLLIVHGTGDDNVHYQGTERLINKLIQADKPFTMMAYPNRSHGISEGKNTTLHLYRLLTQFLLTNLAPGGK